MKKLFLATALLLGTTLAASACVAQCAPTSSETNRADPWIVDWANSYVMHANPYDEATGNWRAGLIVRTGNARHDYFVGEQGLTDAIRSDPRQAQAWAIAVTGDADIRARGKQFIDVKSTDCSTATHNTFAWK